MIPLPLLEPRSTVGVPSPKSSVRSEITVPLLAAACADSVNVVVVPAVGLLLVLIEIVGCGRAPTVTEAEAVGDVAERVGGRGPDGERADRLIGVRRRTSRPQAA